MADSEPALFRAFPGLRGALPHRRFVSGPTPVEPLSLDGFRDGSLFVKRDDESCPLYGGNKPRKLEFLIGEALRRGSRRLVTSGGLGTHHGLATTILGRAVGLATTVVLVPQPLTEEVIRSVRLRAAWGARQVYARSVATAVLESARVLAASTLAGERPYLLWTGGSSARGNLGFVSAGLELAEQVREGLLPEPEEAWVPVGSGGTFVGLVVGLRLAGLRTRVRGVLVTDVLPPSPRHLAASARAVLRLLHRCDPKVTRPELSVQDFELDASELGGGYGVATPASVEAGVVAAARGLRLDATYTAKCFAAMRARLLRDGPPQGAILFWNTFNGIDVGARAPIPPESAPLPRGLRRLIEAGDRPH